MRRRAVLSGLGASAAAAVGGCGAPARLAPLPHKKWAHAPFTGLPGDCRMMLDSVDNDLMGRVAIDAERRQIDFARKSGRPLGEANYLAISGGGENGAYGAGLLTSWAELGTRPEFMGVTGVSTGALIAPFAFLGSTYDKELERVYTTITAADIMVSRGWLIALLSDSIYDSLPLQRLIQTSITPTLLGDVAREYTEKGRLLLVATTHLDVPVGVMWNMGAIAASNHPRALELFRQILLASASIPGVLPPVMIDIETENGRYQEMHVDGATMAEVLLYPPSLGMTEFLREARADREVLDDLMKRSRRLYIIRNARPGTDPKVVERKTFTIAARALATLVQSQGIGDLYQLYLICQRDGIDYNLAYISRKFTATLNEPFEQAYMRKLYAFGRQEMAAGRPWAKVPPGYDPTPAGSL